MALWPDQVFLFVPGFGLVSPLQSVSESAEIFIPNETAHLLHFNALPDCHAEEFGRRRFLCCYVYA